MEITQVQVSTKQILTASIRRTTFEFRTHVFIRYRGTKPGLKIFGSIAYPTACTLNKKAKGTFDIRFSSCTKRLSHIWLAFNHR